MTAINLMKEESDRKSKEEMSSPVGKLTRLDHEFVSTAENRTAGAWYLDEAGVHWFLKSDRVYSELQTSAEIVSSEIYRFFGYSVPDTVLLELDGLRYSAAKEIPGGEVSCLHLENSPSFRQLRVIAAYLKDWDRLESGNSILFKDGSFALLDFGGTLGARAQGDTKGGSIFSKAIGTFRATERIDVILEGYDVGGLPEDHPWRNLTEEDVQVLIKKFENLSNFRIRSIVEKASFSRKADEDYLIQALRTRRQGIISNLTKMLPTNHPPTQKYPDITVDLSSPLLGCAGLPKYLGEWSRSDISEKDFQEMMQKVANEYQMILDDAYSDVFTAHSSLSRLEGLAIYFYTHNAYYEINRRLRSNDKQKNREIKRFVELTKRGLTKFPPYDGMAYRGTDFGLDGEDLKTYIATLRPGSSIVEKAFTSASLEPDSALSGHCMLIIRSKSGRFIREYSATPNENEVLFLPDTTFIVESKQHTPEGEVIIFLREQNYLESLSNALGRLTGLDL